MPGRPTSQTTTSKRSASSRSSPCRPSWTTLVSCPSMSRKAFRVSAASGLSSMISTRQGARAALCWAGATARGSSQAGRRRMKRLPWPTPGLSAWMVPPCIATRLRTTFRPTPRPPSERASERGPWVNRSKMCGSTSGAMPVPLSATVATTWSASPVTCRVMVPPSPVYFEAFPSRLVNTWARRTRSPQVPSGSGGSSTSSCWPRSRTRGMTVSTAWSMTSARASASRVMVILPLLMRAASSRSSSRLAMWSTWRRMTFEKFSTWGEALAERSSSIEDMLIGTSGLRSSCASMARNSFWRRLVASASSRRLCSLMAATTRCSLASRRRATLRSSSSFSRRAARRRATSFSRPPMWRSSAPV